MKDDVKLLFCFIRLDSYLSKLTQVKKPVHYKPYTGRDFEQFKKNYAFGSGHLGFDYDNPEYKEKVCHIFL